jgi:hypothetical protein
MKGEKRIRGEIQLLFIINPHSILIKKTYFTREWGFS